MAKPLKVRYDWMTCVIDGVIARRVQTLGSTTDLTEERILELGDSGYAEVLQNEATDRVSITVDTNDFGSVNTIALLATKYDKYDSARGGSGDIDEPGGFRGSEGDNTYYVTADMFEDAAVAITAPLSEDGINLDRTALLENCVVNSLSFSYDVGGNAAENYGLQTNNKRWFLGWKKKAIALPTYPDTDCGDAALIYDIDLSGATNVPVGFTIDGEFISDPENITFVTSGTDTRVNKLTGTAFSFVGGERLRTIYVVSGTEVFTQLSSTPAGLGSIRRGYVDMFIAEGDASESLTENDKTLRLQSVAIDVDLSRETLEQLGTDAAYSTTLSTPIPITVTATMNDSDLDLWAKLAGVDLTVYDTTELNIEDFLSDKDMFVMIYKSKTSHVVGNLLKMIRLTDLTVTGETHNLTVGDIASQEFTMLAESIVVSGTGVSPLL